MSDDNNVSTPEPEARATRGRPRGTTKPPKEPRKKRNWAADYAVLQGKVNTAVRLLEKSLNEDGVAKSLVQVAMEELKG